MIKQPQSVSIYQGGCHFDQLFGTFLKPYPPLQLISYSFNLNDSRLPEWDVPAALQRSIPVDASQMDAGNDEDDDTDDGDDVMIAMLTLKIMS